MIKIKVFTVIISWLLLSAMVSGCVWLNPPAIIRTVVSETLVTQVVDELPKYPSIAYSPDGKRVAYITERGGKKYVVSDGIAGKKGYDAIGTPLSNSLTLGGFSLDSKRLAYIGIEKTAAGNKFYAVIDGEEGDAYTSGTGDVHSSVTAITFSPDSKHVAYNADGFVFLDQVRVSPEGIVRSNPLFSPDSQHLAYIIERSGGGKCVVLDGIPGKPYGLLGTMAFSPDGQHLAYRAMVTNTRWVMVVDGKEVSQYESNEWHFQDIVFSPDSKHLAYVAGENYRSSEHSQFVVLDGKELTRHESALSWGIVFSPDSNRLAYGNSRLIVVDGVEIGDSSSLSMKSFVFSPDSKRYAYMDFKSSWLPLDTGISAEWAVIDGVKGKNYKGMSDIIFSPDSKHVAYHASNGKKQFVVVDDTSKKYDRVGRIVWDSTDRFHYLAWKGNSIYLVEETIKER